MKKLVIFLNGLAPAQQRRLLVITGAIFALLLVASLSYNPISIKSGYAPSHIGRATDTLTKQIRPWKNNANSY